MEESLHYQRVLASPLAKKANFLVKMNDLRLLHLKLEEDQFPHLMSHHILICVIFKFLQE